VIGTALGWSVWPTIALAVTLAFLFGLSLTALPLLRAGIPTGEAFKLAYAADFVSIAIMEIVDNAAMLLNPAPRRPASPTPCSGGAWPARWRSPRSRRSR
jgi:hypothetical protein